MFCVRIILACILVGLAGKISAQDECELTLVQAIDEFNAGHLYGIPGMLKDCLDKNQNREWRQRAYLLLSETYLLLEDPIGAEQSYLNVLWANPEFVTEETRDPIDLVYLSRKFTATPIFALHGYVGPNTSPVHVINDVRIGGESYTREKYQLRIGWQVGVGLDYNYNDYLSASVGAGFLQTSYKHTTTDLFGVNKDMLEFIDHQGWMTFPLTVKFSEVKGKLRRYAYVGYAFNYLLTDNADVEVNNRDLKSIQEGKTPEYSSFPKSLSNISMLQNRSRTNGGLLLGCGVKYKYNLDYFYIDGRYSFGLKNIADPSKRYNSVTEGLPFPYVDDDFRMDNLTISVGYIHPLYKPRKLKKARTKSVLRAIERGDREKN